MVRGSKNRTKNEIIIYMIICILIEGKLYSEEVKNKFNLSNLTFYRYMSLIKIVLCDFGFYYIEIIYNRIEKCYICNVNIKINSFR